MQRKASWVLIAVIGLILGFSMGYFYTSPTINQLNSEISLLENQLNEKDSSLTNLQSEIESISEELEEIKTDYDEKKSEFDSLSLDYEELTLKNNELEIEYQELLEKFNEPDVSDDYESLYEELYIKYLDLLKMSSKYGYSIEGPYESFLDYTEIDEDKDIILNEERVSWKEMDRFSDSKIWREYNETSEYFIHQFVFCFTEIDPGDSDYRDMIKLWELSSDNNTIILSAVQDGSNDDEYYMKFQQLVHDNRVFYYKSEQEYDPLLVDKRYLARISKSEDRFKVEILDANNGTLLITSKFQDGTLADFNQIAFTSMGEYSSDLTDWSSGYIEKLKIFK